jgi:tetratricopeptide (TPR) repeat protein/tRNA A-37 threonylcarbamoyl transferase component Bud32
MIGTTVTHYKILEKIGEGGMGEVYLAEDTKLKRQVSLKFLSEELTRDEDRKQRFIQEARAAAAIQHPHIAAVYDIDEADGRTFIAMEYIPGQSRRDVVDAKKLSFRRSLELGFQVADGLAKAHEKGVVHRDIKPENILISEDGYAKIIDFGLAKLLEPFVQTGGEETATKLKTKEGLVMGTVAYMSPEQARGETVDARSDIFSFGAVLYEMLSGQGAFRRNTLAESLSAVLKDNPSPLTLDAMETPPDLQRVFRKALAKEPSERYQSMKDLALDLKELRDEIGSTTSRPVAAVPTETKFPWTWVAAAGVVLLSVIVGWLLLGRDQGPVGIGEAGRPAIAVMYFESMSGDEEVRWLSKGLPNMLITNLAQTPGLDVVSSQRIQKILKDIGQEDLESIDMSLVDEVARKAGAGAVVVGSIFKSGDDVGTGRVLSAESVQGRDVFPLVDELTGRIRRSLQLGDQPAGRPIADVTTPSLQAFQLYSEGVEARLNFRRTDAQRLLEQAVQVDPSFAMAYFELYGIASARGESNLADRYLAKVVEHQDHLSERQKLLVQARDANWERGEPEEAVELLETLITRYPDEQDAYLLLDVVYGQLNQPEQARAALERGVEAIPSSGRLHNEYGYDLLRAGRFPEGLRELETYARLNPDEPNPQDSLAEAYLITGQPEKAIAKYSRVLEMDPNFGPSYAGRAWSFAVLGRYDEALAERAKLTDVTNPGDGPTTLLFVDAFILSRVGRYREAEEQLEQAIHLAGSQGDWGSKANLEQLSALLALEKEEYSDALKIVSRSEASIAQIDPPAFRTGRRRLGHLLVGVAEARRGNLEAAGSHLDSQAEIYDPRDEGENWFHQALRGEIALAAGDLAGAEAAFLDGEPEFKMWFNAGTQMISLLLNNLPFRDGLARVKKAQGDLPGAIEIYRDLLTPDIGSKWTAMLEPRYVLELARLLDETGDKEGARAEYQRFLKLWKDADKGLPELKEARKYVAK